MPTDELCVVHLGVVDYAQAHALQERVRTARAAEAVGDVLLLLEHPPVLTRGRRPDPGGLPEPEQWYRERGVEVVSTNRGGRLTYHGPGQLVGYPIMRTPDVVAFVRTMERALVTALEDEGIAARTRTPEGSDYTGVWVAERKIASIGLHLTRGVTTHGFAVNVDNDLTPFDWVVACGLPDVAMTSITQEQPERGAPRLPCFRRRVALRFAEAHGLRQRLWTPGALERALGPV